MLVNSLTLWNNNLVVIKENNQHHFGILFPITARMQISVVTTTV